MDYKKIYDNIVTKARQECRWKLKKDHHKYVYYEAHHIVPLCVGGEGRASDWRWHTNIILLTAKEHYMCHKLLCEIHPNSIKIVQAFLAMCNTRYNGYRPSARAFAEAKYLKNKIGISDEVRKKISDAKKGSRNPQYGKSPTTETLTKMKEAKLGVKKPQEAIKKRVETWKINGNAEKTANRFKKKLLHVESGVVYESHKAAAIALNIRPDAVTRKVVKGIFKNI